MDRKQQEMVERLMEAIMTLETVEECFCFFSDLCTSEELTKFARRIQIAKMISSGYTYRRILKETNASNITISRLKSVMEKEGSVLSEVVTRI